MALSSSPVSWFFLFKGQAVRPHAHELPGLAHAIYAAMLICYAGWLQRLVDGLCDQHGKLSGQMGSELVTRLVPAHTNTRGQVADRGRCIVIRYAGRLTFGRSSMAACTASAGYS